MYNNYVWYCVLLYMYIYIYTRCHNSLKKYVRASRNKIDSYGHARHISCMHPNLGHTIAHVHCCAQSADKGTAKSTPL